MVNINTRMYTHIYIYHAHGYHIETEDKEEKRSNRRERTYVLLLPRDMTLRIKEKKKREDVIKKEKYVDREKEIERETERKRNSTLRNYYEIAKKLMIINEALNRVTSRRIERRFLPSVRAASENANRKRIQDLSLEVIRVRSWRGEAR